jgi:hypothetical protein
LYLCEIIDEDLLILSVSGNTDVIVSIDVVEVTFSAADNWNGSETLIFTVDDGVECSRDTAFNDVEIVVTPVNDEPVLIGFLPEETEFTVILDSIITCGMQHHIVPGSISIN